MDLINLNPHATELILAPVLANKMERFRTKYFVSCALRTTEASEPEFYGDLVYRLKKIAGSNNFSAQFIKIISHYRRLAITLMYCNRLYAWWSTQSWLATLLASLIARWWVGPQTL